MTNPFSEDEHSQKYPKKDPFEIIKWIAEYAIPRGIYRIQRNDLKVFPPIALRNVEKEAISTLYSLFETVWMDSYKENPYAFMTNNLYIMGLNSELTFHVNPLFQTINVTYSIQQSTDVKQSISYPITVEQKILPERPMIAYLLYLEAVSDLEGEETFDENIIFRYSKRYPKLESHWKGLVFSIIQELERNIEHELIDENDVSEWMEGIYQGQVLLHVRDKEALNFPTIAIYGAEKEIDGHRYTLKASTSVLEAAFVFRNDRYTPFTFPE